MVANSIFQLVDGWYIMHNLYHDLAEKLSAGECFRVTGSENAIPKDTVPHVFLKVDNEYLKEKLCSIDKLHNLRTLILGNRLIEDEDMSEIVSLISTNFKNLRVLEIWSCSYRGLPTTVGDLRNLRCLNVLYSSLEKLPDSVSKLYHLQFLLLPESIKTLPVKLSNFVKMRSIEKYDNKFTRIHTLPPIPNLGKLTSLQCLDEFHMRKQEGYEVGQLGSLREICGDLRIVNLENVEDKNEAAKARLHDKPKLEGLELVWSKSTESNSEVETIEVETIEALRPPKNLQLFIIDGYRGTRYPTWLQHSSLQTITHVSFHNCNALSSLPPNFHQFHYCSELILENLEALRELSTFPENLTTLRINKCPCLVLVRGNEFHVDMNRLGVKMKTELSRLTFYISEIKKNIFDHEIKSFKQTGALENYPEQLHIIQNAHLHVDEAHELSSNYPEEVNRAWWSCHNQRMNFVFSGNNGTNKLELSLRLRILELQYCCITDRALSDSLKGMVALEELHLEGIMTITTLPPTQVQSLQSLRVLKF